MRVCARLGPGENDAKAAIALKPPRQFEILGDLAANGFVSAYRVVRRA